MSKTAVDTNTPAKKKRKLQTPVYNSFRLQKKIRPERPKIMGGWKLLKDALRTVWDNKKLFLGIILIYGVLSVVLVQSFSGLDVGSIKQSVKDAFSQGSLGPLFSGVSIFAYLLGNGSSGNTDLAGVYQFVLVLVVSLATIWSLRQLALGKQIRTRDGFYQGMTPFVTVILVLAVVVLQLLPVVSGLFLYNLALPAGSAAGGIELLLWIIIIFFLAVLSLYMLSSSLIALYIVCLPGLRPMTALRSARQLVQYRRWTVMRRVIFLPLMLLLLAALILVPIIIFATAAAVVCFVGLTILALPVIHAYMYKLYRELLREK